MVRTLVSIAFLISLHASSLAAKPGVARWAIKTSVLSDAQLRTLSLDDLLGLKLPTIPPKSATFDPNTARIPGSVPGVPHEGDLVTVTGWLHLVAFESTKTGDEDYHIQLSGDQADGAHCLIIEAPNPDYVSDPALRAETTAIREWVRTNLLHSASQQPSSSGNVMTHVPYVEATGQLFFDATHAEAADPGGGRGKKGMSAVTTWELHPLTKLQFAPRPNTSTDRVGNTRYARSHRGSQSKRAYTRSLRTRHSISGGA